MTPAKAQAPSSSELSWLSDVTELRQPLSALRPIWVRRTIIHSGPFIPHPARHPYCELSMSLAGTGINYLGREELEWHPGDIYLVGPGMPHWGRVSTYPVEYIAIYFLPSVLIELGPESDGAIILRRFTAPQSINDRLLHVQGDLKARLTQGFREILAEFEQERFGREISLRTLLMGLLVQLLRWEQRMGRQLETGPLAANWQPVNQALHYLREHYPEPVYAREVARAAGVSIPRLDRLFYQALGMSWVKYLQGYRVHQAAILLGESRYNVTETAYAVGFQSLSHFNAVFRAFMGIYPSGYAKQSRAKAADSQQDTVAYQPG